ncbi:MAG: flippase-like domain-containing protein [Deltaproteobacteria bacterium]|nr:flippase-like domain-containing protein [Deltaproteobacteria bacterium]
MADGAKPRRYVAMVVQTLIALTGSAATLFYAFHGVDLGETMERLVRSNMPALIAYALINLAIHAVRTVRWGLLVEPLGKVGRRAVFASASVGIPAAMFLPLRLGEFVRPAMLVRNGVGFAGGMAAVVVERVADGLVNVGLFFALLGMIPGGSALPEQVQTLSRVALVGFGGASLVLVVMALMRERAVAMAKHVLSPLPAAIAKKLLELISSFLEGVHALASVRRSFMFVLLTAIYWAASGWSFSLIAASYGLELPLIAGPFTVSALVFTVMIPAAPGFAGTYELGVRLGLAPFGVSGQDAAVVAVASHIVQLGIQALILGAGLLAVERGAGSLFGSVKPPERPGTE